jgi:hypothetical protein
MQVFMYSVRYICSILTTTGMFQQAVVKLPNINVQENLFSISHVVTCEQALLKLRGACLQLFVENATRMKPTFGFAGAKSSNSHSSIHAIIMLGFRDPAARFHSHPNP